MVAKSTWNWVTTWLGVGRAETHSCRILNNIFYSYISHVYVYVYVLTDMDMLGRLYYTVFTLDYSAFDFMMQCGALHFTACIALHYIALHRIYIAFHNISLHCMTLRCIASHCIALHRIALHYNVLHYIALHCIVLHYIRLRRTTVHLHCIFTVHLHCRMHCGELHFIMLLHCITLH